MPGQGPCWRPHIVGLALAWPGLGPLAWPLALALWPGLGLALARPGPLAQGPLAWPWPLAYKICLDLAWPLALGPWPGPGPGLQYLYKKKKHI